MSVLVLGTAQWGSSYGVTNLRGRPSDESVAEQVRAAKECGVSRLDTAPRYGDAQRRLRPWAKDFQITTKVSGGTKKEIRSEFEASLAEMNLDKVNSILIHDWEELDPGLQSETAKVIEELRDEKLADHVGVSIYEEKGLGSAGKHFLHLDIAQVPANAIDHRLNESEVLADLFERGTIFQVRSVLLQGLLANPPISGTWSHPDLVRFHVKASPNPIGHALAHVLALPWMSELLIGVSSSRELSEIANEIEKADPVPWVHSNHSQDLELIDPRTWALNEKLKSDSG